ncbi:MAG TPA: glycosyltransferase, partial [Acidimicrobiales bacterium]|nr:glycosyltransferase [Acidimicrobiales bacterium]
MTVGARLRIVVVTGIYPPDIGGPATHASDLVAELRDRGHDVAVLTLTDGPRSRHEPGLHRWSRSRPWALRLLAVAAWLAVHRRRYDVVYATGLHPAAVAGARLAGRPVAVKIVGDPAWERSSRLGLVAESFDGYQEEPSTSRRDAAMRALRDWSVRAATAVTTPSEYLRAVVEGWQRGRGPGVRVIGNGVRLPAPSPPPSPRKAGALRALSVGRLVAHKQLDILLDAVAETDGVELLVAGEGPDRARLEARAPTGVRFLGGIAHDEVFRELAAADVVVSASGYEGLPHVVIEALVVGTPVVASAAGGTGEALVDDVNGVLVDPPTPATFAKVLAGLRDDRRELARLADGARRTGTDWHFDRCADAVEALLVDLARHRRPPATQPKVVNLGRGHLPEPVGPSLERKLALMARHLDLTVVGTSGSPSPRRRLVGGASVLTLPDLRPRLLGGLAYYVVAPFVALALASRRRPAAVVCQSPFEAAGVLVLRRLVPRRLRPRVVVEVHGDWRTASRHYGSRRRRVLSPIADRVAVHAVRAADRVRAVGPTMERLVREAGYDGAVERYLTFSEFDVFLERPVQPLPANPQAAFVGVLEPYKAPEVLLAAWPAVVARLPPARLVLAGGGPLRDALVAQAAAAGVAGSVRFVGQVGPQEVAELLDGSTCLALPSRSEGLPRIAVEAMARGRAVVGSRGGGIPDLVEDDVTGRLV